MTTHEIATITESVSPLGHPSAQWLCTCGSKSRTMQPQHCQRSHSMHRTRRLKKETS